MKVLFYSLFNTFLPPFGTQLELIKQEQERNNEIFLLKCNGVLDSCHANIKHNIIKCGRCQDRVTRFAKLLNIPSQNIFDFRYQKEVESFVIPNFKKTEELLTFEYDGIQIGRGVASNLISRFRDFQITSRKYHDLIELNLKMAIQTYLNGKKIIESVLPDLIYVYNGRQAEDRPIIQIAQKKGIKYKTYVSGTSIKKYRVFENSVVHNLKAVQKDINQTWVNCDLSKREEIGISFYIKKLTSSNENLPSFIKKQKEDKLPDNFSNHKKNIAIFNSSEDEVKTFDDWITPLYNEQNEAIKTIINLFQDHPNYHFYLRVHPNLGEVKNKQISEINNFNFPNLTVIPPYSDISTYALMHHCEKIISFGSSTGVEATFWEKPSILFGKSYYDHLDCVYCPKSIQELKLLIETPLLPPKPKINAIIYGYYMANNGKYPVYTTINSTNDVTFKGYPLNSISISTLMNILKFIPHIPKSLHKVKQYKSYGF